MTQDPRRTIRPASGGHEHPGTVSWAVRGHALAAVLHERAHRPAMAREQLTIVADDDDGLDRLVRAGAQDDVLTIVASLRNALSSSDFSASPATTTAQNDGVGA